MKIKDTRVTFVNFKELHVCDVFIYEGEVHMKVATDGSCGKDSNAICISTGEHEWFCDDHQVQPVEAELIIK